MAFAQLKKTILQKAEAEADSIIKAARKESEDSRRNLEMEMEELEKKANEEVKALTAMMENKELASASLEAKKKQLIAKKEMIEKVFLEAEKNLDKKLSRKDRKEIIEALMKKARDEIEVGKVYCNSMDKELVDFKDVEERKMLGGIIAEDKSGAVQVDYSFETLLAEIKEKQIAKINDLLFK